MLRFTFSASRRVFAAPKFALSGLTALSLAACAPLDGPSVPSQQGMSFQQAREDVNTCLPYADAGGRSAVTSGYVFGILIGGLVLGPVVVASAEDGIRRDGEKSAVDRCLAKLGYTRRELTPAEVKALDNADPYDRRRLLNHLVAGEPLESFSFTGS